MINRTNIVLSLLFPCLVFLVSLPAFLDAQTTASSIIQDIQVVTNMEQTPDIGSTKKLIINMSGLKTGNPISRENAANAIQTLWNLGIFSDIQIKQQPMDNGLRIIIDVDILPMVNEITLQGFKEFTKEEIMSAINLTKGMAVGERRLTAINTLILSMYKAKGFLAADLKIESSPLLTDSTKVNIAISINEGEKVKVKTINIVGNEALSDNAIKKVMKNTKEDRWYRSANFNQDLYDTDKATVVALYRTKGYRDMEIARDSTYVDPGTDRMTLTMFINEGIEYHFGKTSFDGNTIFTEKELREKIRYQEGQTFNEQDLYLSVFGYPEQEIQGIETLYNDRGFLKTTIDPVQSVRADSIDIFIDIAEGNVSKVSKVIIEGNTKTMEKVIRRETSLDPGTPFSRTQLDRSRRDIMALNFFDDVQYDYLLHDQDEDVDIQYKVKEKQTGMASMGAGYSEQDRLVGTLSFTNQNLFGRGQSINFNWEMGTNRRAFQVGFGEPWLFDTRTSFALDLYNINSSDYTSAFDEEKRKGGSIRFGRDLRKYVDYSSASLTYRLEDVDYAGASSYYSDYLVTGKTSSLNFTMSRDSRDLPEFATSGTRTSLMFELAGGPLGGDLSYYKYLLNNEFYTPLFWKTSLMIRTQLGFLRGYEENRFVPYSERFMPGGTSWDGIVRGYPNRQVGPLLQGAEVGGETMLVNNIELQVPLVPQTLYGIAFFDLGNAWRNLSETNPFDLKRGGGIGARVYVPGVGNIGLDLGYGFDKIEGSKKVGGWRTHFQFGQMW